MDISSLFQQLGIGLGLGLLVGLQRESAASPLAGVRTFPLVTVLGTVCGLLSRAFGGWILAAGIIALVVIIYIGKIIEMSKGHPSAGIVLGGILGGMVSSTATTVSYAKRAAAAPGAIGPAAIVIMIASTVVFARLLLEIATVAPAFLPAAAPWLVALLILSAVGSFALWLRSDAAALLA